MFCTRCGAQNPDGAMFCGTCGASLSASGGGPAPTPGPVIPQVEPRPRRAPILAVIVVAAILLIGGAAVGIWLAFFSPWPIDKANFPDPAVRAVVEEACDKDRNGELSRDEARAVTELAVDDAEAFEGMGAYFPNLERLEFRGGNLALLDVSDLPKLTSIEAANEPLALLDVSSNHELAALSVPESTEVTGLDATLLHESWVVSSVEEAHDFGYVVSYFVERDDEGKVSARRYTDGDNDIRWEYEYDERGLLVAQYEDSYFMGYQNDYTRTFTYDANERLAGWDELVGGYGASYDYDEEGRVCKMSTGSGGDLDRFTTYTYDDEGRLESLTLSYDDSPGVTNTFSYDEEGRLIKKVRTNEEDGEVVETTTYEYDDAGNLVRTDLSNRYDNTDTYSDYHAPVDFSYDGEGRMTKATATLGGDVYTATLTYDERGNLEQIVDGIEGERQATYTLTYTRYFLTEDDREPDSGITVGVEYRPLVLAQRTALVNVWETPSVYPNPEPFAQGESMIITG